MAWAPDYTDLAAVKSYLRIADTVDDVQLAAWITASARAIDKRTNRQFGLSAAAVARTYRRTPTYDAATGLWLLEMDDLQDLTGFLVNGVAYASSGAVLLPDSAALEGRPYERLGLVSWPVAQAPGVPQTNVLTGRWGWSAIPTQVVTASWLQIARWNARRDSPYGIAGSPDQGSEMRLLARLDPDVATTLAGLSRRRRVA